MHLIQGVEGRSWNTSYHTRRPLTRPGSLPYVFRRLRIHRNLTKHALAEKFSRTERYISDVENGFKFPSLRFCLECGELFGANPLWVKGQWAREYLERFSQRLLKRLGLDR